MTYILFVILLNNGTQTTAVMEFQNRVLCQTALETIKEKEKQDVNVYCFEKMR